MSADIPESPNNCNVLFLYSNPLRDPEKPDEPPQQLDFSSEKKFYSDILNNAQVTHRVITGPTMTDFFDALFPDPYGSCCQPTILHISCHAEEYDGETCLLFESFFDAKRVSQRTIIDYAYDKWHDYDEEEDECVDDDEDDTSRAPEEGQATQPTSGRQPTREQIRYDWFMNYIQENNVKSNIQLLVLNACAAEPLASFLAETFQIPHVIAAKRDVPDREASAFFNTFYNKLFFPTAKGTRIPLSTAFRDAKSPHNHKGGLSFALLPRSIKGQPDSHAVVIPIDKTTPQQLGLSTVNHWRLPPYDAPCLDNTLSLPPNTLIDHGIRLSQFIETVWGTGVINAPAIPTLWLLSGAPKSAGEPGYGKKTLAHAFLNYFAERNHLTVGYTIIHQLSKDNISPPSPALPNKDKELDIIWAKLSDAQQCIDINTAMATNPLNIVRLEQARDKILLFLQPPAQAQASSLPIIESLVAGLPSHPTAVQSIVRKLMLIVIPPKGCSLSSEHRTYTLPALKDNQKARVFMSKCQGELSRRLNDIQHPDGLYLSDLLKTRYPDLYPDIDNKFAPNVISPESERIRLACEALMAHPALPSAQTFTDVEDLTHPYLTGAKLQDLVSKRISTLNSGVFGAVSGPLSPNTRQLMGNSPKPLGMNTKNNMYKSPAMKAVMIPPQSTGQATPTHSTTLTGAGMIEALPPQLSVNQSYHYQIQSPPQHLQQIPQIAPTPPSQKTLQPIQSQQSPPQSSPIISYPATESSLEPLKKHAKSSPSAAAFAKHVSEVFLSYTTSTALDMERDFIVELFHPFFERNAQYDTDPKYFAELTRLSQFIDICSEERQSAIAKNLPPRNPTPDFYSLQHLRKNYQLVYLTYKKMNLLMKEPSPGNLEDPSVSICFLPDRLHKVEREKLFVEQFQPPNTHIALQCWVIRYTADARVKGFSSTYVLVLDNQDTFRVVKSPSDAFTKHNGLQDLLKMVHGKSWYTFSDKK